VKITATLFISFLFIGILNAENSSIISYTISSENLSIGIMKMTLSSAGAVVEMNTNIMGNSIKIKTISKASDINKSYIINDSQKSYSIIENKDDKNQKEEEVVVVKIGEETINGYKCTHSKITKNGETTEMWTTKSILNEFEKYNGIVAAIGRGNTQSSTMEMAMKKAGCDGFPVKIIQQQDFEMEDEDNLEHNETVTKIVIELVSVEKKDLPLSTFEIPAGYKEVSALKNILGGEFDAEKFMNMSPEEKQKFMEEMQEKFKED